MTAHLLRSVLVVFTAGLGLAAEYPKAYTSNGQVWIQTTASQGPFQATHDGTLKSAPHVSPNGKLIVYDVRESLGENRLSPLNVVFLDWSGKEIRRFREVPMKELAADICGYGSVEWIDDDHVGVACEYNPSGEDYLVLNALSGKVEKEFPGLYFSWSPDHQTLAHVGWIIHFATPANQNYCLLFNDRPVYTPGCSNEVNATPKKVPARRAELKNGATRRGNRTAVHVEPAHFVNVHQIDPPLVWSPNGRNLAFVERIYDFDWGMDETGEETRETSNSRYFLAVVSTGHPAVGYRFSETVSMTQLEWLNDSRVKV